MQKSLSTVKDVDQKIISELDDYSLLEFCKSHKYGRQICADGKFWERRLIKKFGRVQKNENRTWKNFYLTLVYYQNTHKDEALRYAISKGIKNLDVINFFLLRSQNYFGFNSMDTHDVLNKALVFAAGYGNLDLVKYFISRGADDIPSAMMTAEFNLRKNVVKYLRTVNLE